MIFGFFFGNLCYEGNAIVLQKKKKTQKNEYAMQPISYVSPVKSVNVEYLEI